jgi:hypothetical protein
MKNTGLVCRRLSRLVILICLLLLQSCGGGSEKSEPAAVTLVGNASATVGVKNFRQLEGSLRAVLGVSPVTDEVRGILKRLPIDGKADKVSSSSLLATVQLVGAYCEQFIGVEVRQKSNARRVHGKVDFFSPASKFSAPARQSVVQNYAQVFWQRMPTEAEQSELLALMADIESQSEQPKKKLWEMLMGVCTAAGSSVEFIRI